MRPRLIIGLLLIAAGVGLYLFLGRRAPSGPAKVAQKEKVGERPGPERPPGPVGAPGPRAGGEEGPRIDVEDDPVGTLRLEGQVIDADEKPVAGALVGLSAHPPRTVKTEGDGSFAFDKLVGRQYTLEARKDDAHGGPVTVRLTASKEPVIIVLRQAGGLEVTVVAREDHKPVAGAEVEMGDEPMTVSGTTGADGKVTLRGVEGGWQQVVARAEGFAPGQAFAAVSERAQAVNQQTIELRRGAAVSGKVVDSAGKPIAGARVRPSATSALFALPGTRKDGATSDAAGAWSIPALPEGTFRFEASDDKHAPGASPAVTLDGKTERKDVVVTLGEGARIAGRVVTTSGQPVASATVRVAPEAGSWMGWDTVRAVFTDEKGGFEIDGLPRKKMEVVALSEEASSENLPLDLEAKPEQRELELKLAVTGTIAGVVVTKDGKEVSDAQVSAMPEVSARGRGGWMGMGLRGMARDTTDSSGKFELKGLQEGSYRLRVGRAGGVMAMMQRSTTTAKTGDKDVRVVLEDDGRVKGHVLYADGAAPDTFMVSTSFGPGTSFSGKDGAFEVEAPAGAGSTVTVSGPTFVSKTVGDVTVKGGEAVDVGTITVEKGRSLSGRVLGVNGAPVAGAKVVAGPQVMGSGSELSGGGLFGAPGLKSTTSGDDGSYVLAGVGARSLVIVAESADGRSNMVRVPAGTTSAEIDLPLRTFGSLQGKITSAGKPVGPGMVMAQPQQASRGVLIVQSGEDGSYRFDKIAPDTYRVSAMKQGNMMRGGMQAKVVTVEPEKTAQLDIELPAAGVTVVLTVEPPAGVTVTTAQVILVSGTFSAANADQFNERIGELGPGALHQGFILKSEPVKLDNVEPGTYSACGIPIPGDINSPRDMIKIRDQMDKLVVACQQVTVGASPPEQAIAVKVPAPPPL